MSKLGRLFLVIALLATPNLARTSEFGNVFGSEAVEKQSRQASAEILEALRELFQGLRMRELGEGDGSAQFGAAADQLGQASKVIREIASSFQDVALNRTLTADEIREVQAVYSSDFGPTDIAGLYGQFATETEALAVQIGALKTNAGPVYPQLAGRLGRYFNLAGAVTNIAAAPKK